MNEKFRSPVDGIMVMMTWHCAICKQNWKSMIDQGTLRRMPSYVKMRGRRVETRRKDGSMLRAHEECAKRMIKYMEDRGMTVPSQTEPRRQRKHIISSADEGEY